MRNFSDIKRVVIKIGTNTLSCSSGIDTNYVRDIAEQIGELKKSGIQVLLISSGAIGMGAAELGLDTKPEETSLKQACAAIGQPLLMHEYKKAFDALSITIAQVLLTRWVLNNRDMYLNLRSSVESLLHLGCVPIINENDCVSTDEISAAFGDNDTLSALVASKIDADLLIILSDIDSLYDKDPRKFPDAKPLTCVTEITKTIEDSAGDSGSKHATGGMKTKIKAAKIASNAGCRIVLAHGREKNVLSKILQGKPIGTVFMPQRKLNAKLRWILNTPASGTIEIDDGAFAALEKNKSLLPSGIKSVSGLFEAGSVVALGKRAKAITNLSSAELIALAGKHSSEIRNALGKHRRDVVAVPEDIIFLNE